MRGLLTAYKRRLVRGDDELDELVYVVDSPRVAKLVEAAAAEVGLTSGLTITRLDEVIAAAQEEGPARVTAPGAEE